MAMVLLVLGHAALACGVAPVANPTGVLRPEANRTNPDAEADEVTDADAIARPALLSGGG